VCINEFQSTSDFGGPDDWVEIYNRGAAAYDLSGCFLSDQRGANTKWTFPQGTVLNPGEFLVIYEDALKFGFSSEGANVIMLTAADSTTGLDFYDFGPQRPDRSEARHPDGVAIWSIGTPTKGSPNGLSGIRSDNPLLQPGEITLSANYPNPFNPETAISFSLPSRQRISVKIYNSMGQETATLADRFFEQGSHELTWRASGLPSGLYFYTLTGEGIRKTKNMVLLK
jgi:hypothetical protein